MTFTLTRLRGLQVDSSAIKEEMRQGYIFFLAHEYFQDGLGIFWGFLVHLHFSG